jgi:hypothetical protein
MCIAIRETSDSVTATLVAGRRGGQPMRSNLPLSKDFQRDRRQARRAGTRTAPADITPLPDV